MNRSVIRLLAVMIALLLVEPTFADRRKTSYVPADHPDFTLLESSDSHARLKYRFPGDQRTNSKNKRVYVGIPPEADFTVTVRSWHYDIEFRGDVLDTMQGSLDTIGDATRDVALLEDAISSDRLPFHEIDAIAISVDPNFDSPEERRKPTHQRQKIQLYEVVFDLDWTTTDTPALTTPPRSDAGFTHLLTNFCINSDQVNSLRRKRTLPPEEQGYGYAPQALGTHIDAPILDPLRREATPREDALRIETRGFGMRALRVDDIADQGIDPASVTLDQLRLWRSGDEQPLYIHDDDGTFSSEDAILFYTTPANSDFTKNNIYYLTWNTQDSAPLRATSEAFQATESGAEAVIERKRFDYDNLLVKRGLNDYGWYHDEVESVTKEFPLPLPAFANQGDITVEVSYYNRMRKASPVDFHLGDSVTTVVTQVNQATTVVISATAGQWNEDPILMVELDEEPPRRTGLSGASDKISDVYHLFFDWIDVAYPRPLQLSETEIIFSAADNPLTSLRVRPPRGDHEMQHYVWYLQNNQLIAHTPIPRSGGPQSFMLTASAWDTIQLSSIDALPGPAAVSRDTPSTLRNPEQGYDYVIIAHHSLADTSVQLAERRAADGFDVLLTDVQDIYDEFNFGYPDTEAIKRFLRYGQSEWTGRSPEFVVFVGDSSWDHKDRENTGYEDQVPTYAPINNPQRYGSDQWYGYLWGGVNDECLDLILGRISVRTAPELQRYLTKVATYEDELPVGLWKARNLFITDDGFDRYAREQGDESTPLPVHSTYVIQTDYTHVTNPYLYHRFKDNPSPQVREYLNKKYSPDTTLAILNAMDEGALVLQYVGHGGNQMWSHERIFYGTDRPTSNVLELQPNNRFPFIINWSCLTGYLNYNRPPFHVCLAEEFLRFEDRGGIAIWAPSGGGTTDQHMVLSHMVMRNLVYEGMTRIGEATSMTKTEFLQISHTHDLVDQYTVFGDPAIQLAMPQHTIELQSEPAIYFADREQDFTIRAETGDIPEGMAWISMSVKGTLIHESHPFAFRDGRIEYTFASTPPEASEEGAKVRIYVWNEETGQDAWGGVVLDEFRPVLTLGEATATRDGEQVEVTFDVTNETPIAVEGVALHLMQGVTESPFTTIDVSADITQTVRASFTPATDNPFAYIMLPEQEHLAIEATLPNQRVVVQIPQQETRPVVPVLGSMQFTSQELFAGSQSRVRIPIRNVSSSTQPITLTPPDWTTNGVIRSVTLEPGQERSYDYNVALPEDPGTHTMTFDVGINGTTTSYSLEATILGQPDLALAEGDYTISPDPAIIGHTVTLRTTVYNLGDGPATNVKVEAYIGDPALRKRVTRFNKRTPEAIGRIEPGDMQEIEIIWDPTSYEGLGNNQLYIVVDPVDRISELDETNNQLPVTVELHDLPDLAVDPWTDHKLILLDDNPIPVWGSPMRLTGRVRNVGDTDATYARISFIHNEDEVTHFADRITPGSFTETRFEVPLVSSKNTVIVSADRYDLIAEKNETEVRNNNDSSPKRFDFLLQMPEAPIIDQKRTYITQTETHFSAGEAEWFDFDERSQSLQLSPRVNDYLHRIAPWFVDDDDSYSIGATQQRWHWNPTFTAFFTPVNVDDLLQIEVPVVRGMYEVSIQLNSNQYVQSPTATVEIKTPADSDFVAHSHSRGLAENNYYPLGEMTIESDRYAVDFRSPSNGSITELGNLRFVRNPAEPVTAVYVSPLFPTEGANGGATRLTWEAEEPENTELQLRVRWVRMTEDGSLRYLPWMRTTPASAEALEVRGSGDFLQYSAWFTLSQEEFATPSLANVQVEVPFANGKKLSQGDR